MEDTKIAGKKALDHLFRLRDRCEDYAEQFRNEDSEMYDAAWAFEMCSQWLDQAQDDCSSIK